MSDEIIGPILIITDSRGTARTREHVCRLNEQKDKVTETQNPSHNRDTQLGGGYRTGNSQDSERGELDCSTGLGTVQPDWICMRVVSLKSPLKGHQPLYVFNFFFFDLEFLKQLLISEPLHAKRPLILLLVRFTVCMCSSRDLFRQTVFHKCGRGINCSLDCGSQVKNIIIPQPEPK